MTRQQRYLRDALQRVQGRNGKPESKIYGGLCHTFPILLLTNGLCQTLALIEDKKTGATPRAAAYQAIRSDIAATLGMPEARLLADVQSAPLGEYVRYTRTLLDAWVYYKRFAVSILGVEADERGEGS